MYSFNPGNQFVLGHKKFQILEVIDSKVVRVTDAETGHDHTMSTKELYDAYENGTLFFITGSESLETKTIKKLLNSNDSKIIISEEKVLSKNFLQRDPYTFSKEEMEIIDYRLSFIDEVHKRNLKALTNKHLDPIIDDVFNEKHSLTDKNRPSGRTVRRWYENFVKSGNQSLGLLPKTKEKGNRSDRLSQIKEIIDNLVVEVYLTRNKNSIYTLYDNLKNELRRRNHVGNIPSYEAIHKRIKKMEKEYPFEVMSAREGKVAANEKYRGAKATYQECRALECVEVDSTKLDLFTLFSNGSPAGRPWLTVVRDRYTQCILGFYLGFEPPSILSLSKALKHSFMRKDKILEQYPEIKNSYPCYGLPEVIVCDNGKEYWSKAFKLACRDLGIIVNYSPVKKAWIKGGVESHFKTLNNTLLHQQAGTTFSNIYDKADYDSEKNAVIPFDVLVEIIYTWIVDVYHQEVHKGELDLKTVIPIKRWNETAAIFPPVLPSIDSFDILFGSVVTRTITKKGIELDYIFYSSDELRLLRQNRGDVKLIVKFDPDDISKAYVYDEVTEKYIVVHSLYTKYNEYPVTRWQHKVNIRIAKILAAEVDEESLAEADGRIKQLVKDCFNSDGSVAAKSKVSRHLGIDNEHPLGKPTTGNDDSGNNNGAISETLSGLATNHEVVSTSEITPPKVNKEKVSRVVAGFALSDRVKEKINERKKKS